MRDRAAMRLRRANGELAARSQRDRERACSRLQLAAPRVAPAPRLMSVAVPRTRRLHSASTSAVAASFGASAAAAAPPGLAMAPMGCMEPARLR